MMVRTTQRIEAIGAIVKSASVFTKAVSGHAHVLSLSDAEGSLITGGLTAQSADSGRPPHRHSWIIDKSGRIVIGEAAGHRHAIDQAEATGLLKRIVKGIAAAELGIPDEVPEALRGLTDDDLEFDFTGMSPEEARAARRRNTQIRDLQERQAAFDPAGEERTLADIDQALETRARELIVGNETMHLAFLRLMAARKPDRDPEFDALLDERERVARLGAGYMGADASEA